MRLIVVGCEYAGKTTLAASISRWISEAMGGPPVAWHNHFVLPYVENLSPESDADAEQVATLRPSLQEKLTRYMITYHFDPGFYLDNHFLLVHWYYADAVYAALYYGFGGPGQYADRQKNARAWDHHLMEIAPDTVLVLVRASAEVIRQRRREQPHPRCPLRDDNVERVLDRFQEEYTRTLIRRKFTLDTTSASIDETLQEFIRKIEPHLSEADHLRMLNHRSLTSPGASTA